MGNSLSGQLLDLADMLTEIACETTGTDSKRASALSYNCSYYATVAAIRALKDNEPAYVNIVTSLTEAANAAAAANKALAGVGDKIATVATALDLAVRLIKVIGGVFALVA